MKCANCGKELKQRSKAASIWVLLFYIIVKELKFSRLSYKREKKYPAQKY